MTDHKRKEPSDVDVILAIGKTVSIMIDFILQDLHQHVRVHQPGHPRRDRFPGMDPQPDPLQPLRARHQLVHQHPHLLLERQEVPQRHAHHLQDQIQGRPTHHRPH